MLKDECKIRDADDIDKIIWAQLPDPNDPRQRLYDLVCQHMIHNPCGRFNPEAPCTKNGICSKDYPKSFREKTDPGIDGFALYARPDNGRHFINKDGFKV